MIPVCEPVHDGRDEEYVLDCLRSNWIATGNYVGAFEKAFSKFCNAHHGIACSNGTTAIHLALAALGIGHGDEVIIPSFTLIASANMVILAGARPVLADVQKDTCCIDPEDVERLITPRTKAIMVVHMFGHPCDMDALMAIADKHGLAVIEDGAQAHGAEYKGRRVGAIGHIGCFSFYGNKIATSGEGGMVVTNDAHLAKMSALLRNQAFEQPRFVHNHVGFNYRLTNIQAAIGLAQCEKLDEKVQRKRDQAALYTDLLSGVEDLILPVELSWAKNVYWMYGVVLGDSIKAKRDEVIARLTARGVDTRLFFCPMNLQPVYRNGVDPRFPDTARPCPNSEWLWDRGFYLPSGLSLTAEQQYQVVKALIESIR
ncbi:MAG: DegT/DnrJ/EryC1/StrS family aminotransferase [Alphaproteobacteria bacterium]|nr:DegT/DnrJ/EryC1/StrS family aminotransferase [Alphaproteobacteria bacterium]